MVPGGVLNLFRRRYFTQCDFLYWKGQGLSRERVSVIFKGQLIVLIVMGHIGFVVHDQKFPKRQVLHELFVFIVMLNEQRQSKHLVKLGIGVDVGNEQGYGKGAFQRFAWVRQR